MSKNIFKYAPILLAVTLAACGGGGGSGDGDSGSAQMSNNVTPSGVVEVEAGKTLALSSVVNVLRSSVASQGWSATQTSGDPVATGNGPTIVDASCASATRRPGAPATASSVGVTGSATCRTSLIVPSNATAGEWTVKNSATSVDGHSASGSFVLKVKAQPASTSGFTVLVPSTPQIQEAGKLATLSAPYRVNEGVKVDDVKYTWTQISGTPVILIGSKTASPSFSAKVAGEYVFKVSIAITVAGKVETQEGEIVVTVNNPEAQTSFDVDAGTVQVVQLKDVVQLKGSTVGTATNLTYQWTQVSGPTQITLANANTLTPSFIAQTSGDYVFQLSVSNAKGSKTAVTSVTVAAAPVESAPPTPTFAITAGNAQLLQPNSIVVLKGEVATSTPAPANITYLWKQVSGPTVVISNANSLQASFVGQQVGEYEFMLTATDGTTPKSASTSVVIQEPPQSGV